MTEFNLEEKKVIYNAVRLYQMNNIGLTSKKYEICDKILSSLFDDVNGTGDKPSTASPEAQQ